MRVRDAGLLATRATAPTLVELASGISRPVLAGEWIIARGSAIVDVLNDKAYQAKYEPIVEGLTLARATCMEIEQRTGIGTTRTVEELVKAIARLARIEIGGIAIAFTPGQLEEIKHRAGKRGLTVQQELQRIVDRIKDELFYRS